MVINPFSPKSDQHQISPYSMITSIKREGNENQGHDHQIEIAMIFNKFFQLDTREETLYFDLRVDKYVRILLF